MRVVRPPREMQALSEELRGSGKRIALVPTMGYLHEGHLSLMREGRSRADVSVASVFVNPTQFGPKEDLSAYPRDFDRDCRMMEDAAVDFVFHPTAEDMYPSGFQTYVTVEQVTKHLCGISRPHHFRGVATVVAKLFHIVKPHIALFGNKDYQQVVVVRRMVRDLDMDVEVVGCPIVREPDGLAMSSRNTYLDAEERKQALSLRRSLDEARTLFLSGERSSRAITARVREILSAGGPSVRIDYVSLCDAETLEGVDRIEDRSVLAIAAYVGRTRLIDNELFSVRSQEGRL
ncbi:MAG: pantoate--beta-alanine ligase [bacterium]